jgi:hypothetical protein
VRVFLPEILNHMPIEYGGYINFGPLIKAEMARLRAKGCTKSDLNLYALAYRKVAGR